MEQEFDLCWCVCGIFLAGRNNPAVYQERLQHVPASKWNGHRRPGKLSSSVTSVTVTQGNVLTVGTTLCCGIRTRVLVTVWRTVNNVPSFPSVCKVMVTINQEGYKFTKIKVTFFSVVCSYIRLNLEPAFQSRWGLFKPRKKTGNQSRNRINNKSHYFRRRGN